MFYSKYNFRILSNSLCIRCFTQIPVRSKIYCQFITKIKSVQLEVFEMFRKRDFVAAAISTYLMLFVLLYMLIFDTTLEEACAQKEVCVRFCCEDFYSCKDIFVKHNHSLLPLLVNDEIAFLNGKPPCRLNTKPDDANWIFSSVRNNIMVWKLSDNYFQHGYILSGDNFYDFNEYCVQDIEVSDRNSEVEWALFLCKSPHVEEDVDILSKLQLSSSEVKKFIILLSLLQWQVSRWLS